MATKSNNTYYFTGKGRSGGGGGGGDATDAIKYTPQTLTEPQQMQARKNQGLYYEETTEGEITTPLFDAQEVVNGTEDGYYFKVNTDTPSREQISELILQGEAANFEIFNFEDVGYSVCDSRGNEYFIVLFSEYDGNGDILEPGIYIYADSYSSSLQQLVYEGTTTTVHQIPPKYIPQTVPAVKIEVPSQSSEYYNIGHTILNNWIRSRDVKFSVDIEGFRLSWLSIVDMSDPTATHEGDLDSDTYTFTSAGSYLVILNLVDSEENSRNISAILVVIDIGS